jgi:hypothetical protein
MWAYSRPPPPLPAPCAYAEKDFLHGKDVDGCATKPYQHRQFLMVLLGVAKQWVLHCKGAELELEDVEITEAELAFIIVTVRACWTLCVYAECDHCIHVAPTITT